MVRCGLFLGALLLAGHGLLAYQVVIPVRATEQERFAARELAEHLTKITGEEVPVMPEENQTPEPGSFLIGNTAYAETLAKTGNLAEPEEEEAWLIGDGSRLCIRGGGRRGTIYGVYDYLERLGVLWLTADVTVTPKLAVLPMEVGERLVKMPTSVRYMAWNLPSDALWRVRNRLNGMNAALPEEYGGYYPEASGGDCHYLRQLVPFELCEKEHPDWFATGKDGKPSPGDPRWGASYCTTNPDFRAFVVEAVRKRLNETGAKEIWIGQSDGLRAGCFCPRCSAERERFLPKGVAFQNDDRTRGGEFDPTAIRTDNIPWAINNIAFGNAIAEEIAKTHPDVTLLTLAYAYTVDAPPAGPKPAENLIVYLTGPFGDGVCCSFHGYRQGEFKILNDWVKLGARMRLYTYAASNYGFWYPFPNLIGHAQDIQNLYRDGVRSFFDQGALGGTGSGLVELRAWLSAKMMRAPETPIREAIQTFCRAYYGAGGDAVYDYITGYDEYTKKHGIHGDHGWGNPNAWRKWCNEETISLGIACRERALEAVRGDTVLTERIERAFMEVDWAAMMISLADEITVRDGQLVFWLPEQARSGTAAARRFYGLMMKNGFDRLAEPAYFYGSDSLVALLLRDARVYRVGEADIAPALGGRMLEWRNRSGANILKQPRTIVAFNENYETAFDAPDRIPWTRADFTVESCVPDKQLVLCAVRDNWKLVKTFRWEGRTLSITLDVTNLAEQERRLDGVWKPLLNSSFWEGGSVTVNARARKLDGSINEEFTSSGEPVFWKSADGKTQLRIALPAGMKCRLYFDLRKFPHYSFDYGTVELLPETSFAPGESRRWSVSCTLDEQID